MSVARVDLDTVELPGELVELRQPFVVVTRRARQGRRGDALLGNPLDDAHRGQAGFGCSPLLPRPLPTSP